jgi:hypothetical protein
MKKNVYNKNILRSLGVVLFVCFMAVCSFGQAVNDYGSAATGPTNWGTTGAAWVKCVTAGTWFGATAAAAAPTATDNVWIRSGHTINMEVSAKTCNNLYVDGTLNCSNVVGTPAYLRISGTTLTVSSTGSIPITGFSLDQMGTALTVTGTGSINICRIRPNVANSTLTIDADMSLNYPTGAAWYTQLKDGSILTINQSKTLTTAVGGYISGTTSTTADPATAINFTVNVNGTLTTGSSGGASGTNLCLRAGTGKTATLNVGSTGTVNLNGNLLAPSATLGSAIVNVTAGGKINFTGTAGGGATGTCDISKATTTVDGLIDFGTVNATNRSIGTATVSATGVLKLKDGAFPSIGTGTGVVTLGTGSTVEYYGTTAITLPATSTTYSNLIINNAAGLTLSAPTTVTGALTLTSGSLTLNSQALTMASGSMVKGTGTIIGDYTHPAGSTLAPGASPGTVTINGALTNIGDWAIEIGGATAGTQFDQVLATGATTLTSGTVNVTLISGYDPPLGTAFVILDAASLTGTFTAINLPALLGGKTWATPVYDNAAGTVTITVNAVLSTELVSFIAKSNGNTNLLAWKTANEKDNAAFQIERSANGVQFTNIGIVKGNGTKASASDYTFLDEGPLSISYYRLVSTDNNGKKETSNVVTVLRGANGKTKLYPTLVS